MTCIPIIKVQGSLKTVLNTIEGGTLSEACNKSVNFQMVNNLSIGTLMTQLKINWLLYASLRVPPSMIFKTVFNLTQTCLWVYKLSINTTNHSSIVCFDTSTPKCKYFIYLRYMGGGGNSGRFPLTLRYFLKYVFSTKFKIDNR